MSDLAKCLLSQYYGLGEESSTKKFVSIHESIEHKRGETNKLTIEQTSSSTIEENLSDEESEWSNTDCLTLGVANEPYVLDHVEDTNNVYKDLDNFNIDPGANVLYNVFENTRFGSGEEQSSENIPLDGTKKLFDTFGSEDEEKNNQSSTCAGDVISDNAPDVCSIVARKQSENSFTASTPLPPAPQKELICNETFADCSGAGLVTLPLKMLQNYLSLQMLYLENNNLTELPIELFASLRNLEWLDIRNNQLTTLPSNIKSHPSLETLLLQGNKIETLPLELCLVLKLKTLHVTRNPLIVPSKDIVALGCTAILDFLRTEWNKLHPDEQVKLEKKKVEPKPSTILCYQSPRRNRNTPAIKHPKSSISNRDASKHNVSTREKSRSYKASNRYTDAKAEICLTSTGKDFDQFSKNTPNIPLCDSCLQKLTAMTAVNKIDNITNTEPNTIDKKHVRKRSSCSAILHNQETCCLEPSTSTGDSYSNNDTYRQEIDEINSKILRFLGPSPRSLYVRKNVRCLKTYRKPFGKECRVEFSSNQFRNLVPAKVESRGVALTQNDVRQAGNEKVEKFFDIMTKDGKRLKLHPMRLKSADWILSCLENYITLKNN